VFNFFENFAKFQTSGFDFNIGYRLPLENWGTVADAGALKFMADATFLSSYNQYLPNVHGDIEPQGLTGQNIGDNGYPRWKINPGVAWERGPWKASWSARIVWHQVESCDDGLDPTLVELGLCSDPNHIDGEDNLPDPQNELATAMRNDLQIGYNFEPWKADLSFGVLNFLDQDPPISYSAFANSMDASDYWVPGVFGYVSLKKMF
jgi:iron complex outermembrane recepter protein